MGELEETFGYVAVTLLGRRVRGTVIANSEAHAFERLRLEGLSPIKIRKARARRRSDTPALSDRDTANLISNLAELLRAGADMRTALGILGSRYAKPPIIAVCRGLAIDIGGGEALEAAFARHLGRRQALIGALVAAGETSGDLAGGLSRAAELIQSKLTLQEKLISILAYPLFVLGSTIAAVFALLLFVIPTLAPLIQDTGAEAPAALSIMIAVSDGLRSNLTVLGIAAALLGGGLIVLAQLGILKNLVDQALLDGPLKQTVSRLTFGAFAIAIGGMLTAGAPMSETLKLAIRAVNSNLARARLEPVLRAVRQGQSLSASLEAVRGFPHAISRLAAVGEATGSLGPMLTRAGKLEEEAAVRRIEQVGQILGPALIVGLGGLVGLLMASLLSGVSQLGGATLQ
jgi:type II secretory pathway component PulF